MMFEIECNDALHFPLAIIDSGAEVVDGQEDR